MFILVIEFVALVVICYVFLVYATRKKVALNNGKRGTGKLILAMLFLLLSFFVFAAWFIELGLTS